MLLARDWVLRQPGWDYVPGKRPEREWTVNTEPIVVFQGSLSDVKEVAQLLEREGISPKIENPSCSTSS